MDESLAASDRKPQIWAFGIIAGAVLFGALLGFVIIPALRAWTDGTSAWLAICAAIGVPPAAPASGSAPQPPSKVSWRPNEVAALLHADKAAGARLAQGTCGACHMPTGATADPSIPGLAGQSAFALYKQLRDYKEGSRANPIMSGMAANLTLEQIVDVAAYYAGLTRGDIDQHGPPFVDSQFADLAISGEARRALPPCQSCHGASSGGPIEAPVIAGQSSTYVAAQLRAYARGERHNDLFARMRTIAAKLSDHEIDELANYYSVPR
jgi:cytochrome c553